MNLRDYISEIGDEEAAERFRVKVRTARSWRLGDRRPRPSQVPTIIDGSGGKLSWESIYEAVKKTG